MLTTLNYGLKKPDYTDPVDVGVFNENMDTVDALLKGKYDANSLPPYPVTSVNGQTGAVTIPTQGAVTSVNGQIGAVRVQSLLTVDAIEVEALVGIGKFIFYRTGNLVSVSWDISNVVGVQGTDIALIPDPNFFPINLPTIFACYDGNDFSTGPIPQTIAFFWNENGRIRLNTSPKTTQVTIRRLYGSGTYASSMSIL